MFISHLRNFSNSFFSPPAKKKDPLAFILRAVGHWLHDGARRKSRWDFEENSIITYRAAIIYQQGRRLQVGG